jgi:hypothetical protein
LPKDRQGGSYRCGTGRCSFANFTSRACLICCDSSFFLSGAYATARFSASRTSFPGRDRSHAPAKFDARPMPTPAACLRVALRRTVSTAEITAAKLGEKEGRMYSPQTT